MQIEATSDGDILELAVRGALDNESSVDFRDHIDDHVRDGWHRILVQMRGVTYISSAGIGALVAAKKRLEQLKGEFGVYGLTPEVERVLTQTRLLDSLLCDPQKVRTAEPTGQYTRSLTARIARADGLDLQIYVLDRDKSCRCRLIGDPRPIYDSMFTPGQCHSIEISEESIVLGLGGLGDDFAAAGPKFGELLAAAGAVAQSAQSRRGLPDYSLSQGKFVPRAQILYGVKCEGEPSQLVRFQPAESGAPHRLSAITAACLQQTRCALAAVVILAESAGLLGVHLRRSPAADRATDIDRFGFPEVRQWLSFSPERIYHRNLALLVGVAQSVESTQRSAPLSAMLRPMDSEGKIQGHFHAAIFPYLPLKKRTLDLHASIRGLFESGGIQDVLHLLRDDRPIVGAGESELLGGACWVSPIHEIESEA